MIELAVFIGCASALTMYAGCGLALACPHSKCARILAFSGLALLWPFLGLLAPLAIR